MIIDPISDFLIQIKNGYMARKDKVVIPHSKLKESLAEVLSETGIIGKVETSQVDKKKIVVELLYVNKKPKAINFVRISKPSRRVYVDKRSIPYVLGKLGVAILSTAEGIMTGVEARKKGIGGELICKIW